MASKLTVVFFIFVCLEAGAFLTVLPWIGGGGYWGGNYFLVYTAQKMGAPGLQRVVASGWVRGAVTGLGLLNLAMAFWEAFHFRETVRRLQGLDNPPPAAATPDASARAQAQTDVTVKTDTALKTEATDAGHADAVDAVDVARADSPDNLPRHERRDD
jgi:hypothetical protein